MDRTGFIYFMCNTYNNVLYVGVTNDLRRRVAEHKAKINKGFTYKYNCDKLVYFEEYDLVVDAIAREKQIKNWKREWKNELVNKVNPDWNDLSERIGVNDDFIKSIKEYYQGIAGQARNDVRTDGEARNDVRTDGEARNDDSSECLSDESQNLLNKSNTIINH